MKEPTINQVVIAQQMAQIKELKTKVDLYEKELIELARVIDVLQTDYNALTNEYIDLREEYNVLQSRDRNKNST